MQKRNLAARAGMWSAAHRKTAILGWLAFVLVAVLVGGSVGQQKLAQEDMGDDRPAGPDQPSHRAR